MVSTEDKADDDALWQATPLDVRAVGEVEVIVCGRATAEIGEVSVQGRQMWSLGIATPYKRTRMLLSRRAVRVFARIFGEIASSLPTEDGASPVPRRADAPAHQPGVPRGRVAP